MMDIQFTKMSGAGNDFVVINNMDGHLPEAGRESVFKSWCRRGMSIGADGVLVVEPSTSSHFRMRYHNADGREAETCGNGSRCIARFAHLEGVAPARMSFDTLAGVYEAEVAGEDVMVSLSEATGIRMNIRITDSLFDGDVHFINTGVPHAVIFTDKVQSVDVFRIGRHLRHHPEFAPAGTNANFVQVRSPQEIVVRTYERGVEYETLACGTGSVASAIIAQRLGLAQPEVRVETASGEMLSVNFQPTEQGAERVRLGGSARVVYRGIIEADFEAAAHAERQGHAAA